MSGVVDVYVVDGVESNITTELDYCDLGHVWPPGVSGGPMWGLGGPTKTKLTKFHMRPFFTLRCNFLCFRVTLTLPGCLGRPSSISSSYLGSFFDQDYQNRCREIGLMGDVFN